jgi:hypothetical protein
MSRPLDVIHRALDTVDTDVEVFFRDDDAGWADDRLLCLLDLFAAHQCPIDLAVIPTALSDTLAARLRARRDAGAQVGFHQHGYSHANHEAAGRPCEFGASRTPSQQRGDVVRGRHRLFERLGNAVDPIFTPPWNRCSPAIGDVLLDCQFDGLSRDTSADSLNVTGLRELPVHVDWFAKSKGQRLAPDAWAAMAARALTSSEAPVGVMLHHAQMDSGEMQACHAFVRTVARHPKVRVLTMREVAARS